MATVTHIIEEVMKGNDISQPIILVTHKSNPKFHSDEVSATALLSILFNKYKIEWELVKTFNPEELGYTDDNPNCIVYDIGMGMYDHHQPDGQNSHCIRIDEDGTVRKYSSVGLIWKEIGHYLVPDEYVDEVYNNLIKYIDDHDNGFENNPLSYCISNMNDPFSSNLADKIDTVQDLEFNICVNTMSSFFNNIFTTIKAKKEEEKRVNELINEAKANNKQYVISDNYYVGMTSACAKEEIPFYIYPNVRGGWCFRTITPIGEDMNVHFVDIPESVRNWDGITFLHPNRFLGSAETKEIAIETVETIIKMANYFKEFDY